MTKRLITLLTAVALLGGCAGETVQPSDQPAISQVPIEQPVTSQPIHPDAPEPLVIPLLPVETAEGALLPGEDYGLLLPYQTEEGYGLMTVEGVAVTGPVYANISYDGYAGGGSMPYPAFYYYSPGLVRGEGDPFYREVQSDEIGEVWGIGGPFGLIDGHGRWVTEEIYYASRDANTRNPYGYLLLTDENEFGLIDFNGEEAWRQKVQLPALEPELDYYLTDGDSFWQQLNIEEPRYDKRSFATGEIIATQSEAPVFPEVERLTTPSPFYFDDESKELYRADDTLVHVMDKITYLRWCWDEVGGDSYFEVKSRGSLYYYNEDGAAVLVVPVDLHLGDAQIYELLGMTVGADGRYFVSWNGTVYTN